MKESPRNSEREKSHSLFIIRRRNDDDDDEDVIGGGGVTLKLRQRERERERERDRETEREAANGAWDDSSRSEPSVLFMWAPLKDEGGVDIMGVTFTVSA